MSIHYKAILFACIFSSLASCGNVDIESARDPEGVTETPFPEMTSFVFKAADNPALQEDISMSVSDGAISGYVPLTADRLKLVPSFTFKGVYVSADGRTQTSGKSLKDFSQPQQYVVHGQDGASRAYNVTVSRVNSLPVVRLETEGGAEIVSKEVYVNGSVMFGDPDMIYSEVAGLSSQMRIKGRGNTTWTMPKKPWKVKLDEKKSPFGMPKSKDWILLANYSDKTLLRNMAAMEMSRICGMEWTPVMKSVSVYLNSQYQGVYTICEQKEVGKNKVDISPVAPEETGASAIQGDYYLEVDCNLDGPCHFTTGKGIPIVFSDPETPSDIQKKHVMDYFTEFENALYSDEFKDPDTGYRHYIDLKSFIDYYIIAELAKNIDGNTRKSMFLVKTKDGIRIPHIWDYDLAFGNCNYFDYFAGATNGPEGWFVRYYTEKGRDDGWYGRMFQDPYFRESLKTRWSEVYDSLKTIPAFVDKGVKDLYGEQKANFERWPVIGVWIWPNLIVGRSYEEEVRHLKDYYTQRLQWMDRSIKAL